MDTDQTYVYLYIIMKALLSFILCGLFSLSSYAVTDISFLFRYYNVENGLSSNRVNAIVQDSKGYIWIGTDKGLNRYDGRKFIYYQKSNNDKHQLGDNRINSLYESSQKVLWVGTFNGVYLYDHKADQFSYFTAETNEGVSINTLVSSITQDKDGLFWISTRGQGVFSFDIRSQSLRQYEIVHSQKHIYTVLADHSNNIWLAGMSSTYLLDKVNDCFDKYTSDDGAIYSTALYEDSMNNLWIGTWENGLLKLSRNQDEPAFYLDPTNGKGILHVHSILEYAPGILLIGSDQGLAVFNTITGSYKEYDSENRENKTLSNKFVYPIIKDNEGGIWIGTSYGGINYIPPHHGQFEGYNARIASGSYMNGDIVSCFTEDDNGNIWIGSEDGGVSCFSTVKQEFINYPGREKTFHLHVNDLCIDGNTLWIGTYAEGLNSLDMRTGHVKRHTDELPNYYVYSLLKDSRNRMWIGSGHSIYLYSGESGEFTLIKKVDALIGSITEDPQGKIWFSTVGNGLFSYEPKKDNWKQYEKEDGLPVNIVNHICVDRYDRLWIATDEGLGLYNNEKDIFEYIPLHRPSEDIYCILEGGNSLWLTTGKGLIHYSHDEGTMQTFSKSDGLQSEVFIGASGLKSKRGKLYVGTINGFNTFYPHRILQNTKEPTVVLTGLELFNEKVPVTEDGILTSRIDYMDEIHLSHGENVVSIFYAALSYCSPDKNQYAYKLEGFDKNWNYVESETKATYTNLPIGTYKFHVKASNNDNIWNERGSSLRIVIHPPFYLTTPFKILYFIIIAISVFCILRFLFSRKERKHLKEIEILNVNKDKEIHEAKINFFTTIAHEIRTPVSLIIGPLETIKNASVISPPVISDNLETIYRNSQRLLFLINQLLDFRKVEDKKMKMYFRSYIIADLLQAECERFHSSMTQHPIHFQVEYPASDFMAAVDKEAFTKVISNLLSNAFKYTKDRVEVSCRVQIEKGQFVIRVTDNGEGIEKEVQEHIFKPFYQKNDSKAGTGIGLSIVKDIVKAHNGFVEIDSRIGEYTSLIVYLPIKQTVTELRDIESDQQLQTPGSSEMNAFITQKSVKPTMLIVDDNEEMLQFLGEHFKTYYHIIKATDGNEALELLREHEVTLIISDWMMPNMDGIELCKAVRSNLLTSHIPFILLTAKTEMQSKITGLDEGADDYIEKPFSLLYMEARIRNLIEQRDLLRKKFSEMPTVPLNSIAGNAADEKFLSRMNQIIESNIANPDLSVDFLAEELGISRSGLFAKLKNLANVTPNELIHIIRLKKAAALLLEKHYRVNEVCYMVGFKDPSYFSKCFQKQFGIKPVAYVKEYGKRNSA